MNRSNLGPFKGTGKNKKEAKLEACKLAMDAIEEKRQYYLNLVQSNIKQKPQTNSRVPPFTIKVPDNIVKYLEEAETENLDWRQDRNRSPDTGAVVDVSLESDLSAFVVERPSYIFMIDLDNSTHTLNSLIQDCKVSAVSVL